MQRCSYLLGSLIFFLSIQGMAAIGNSPEKHLDFLSEPEHRRMVDDVVGSLDLPVGEPEEDFDDTFDDEFDGDLAMLLGVEKESKECGRCLRVQVNSTMVHAFKVLHKICQHAKEQILKNACEDFSRHPKEMYGYLLVKTRAYTVSKAYCTGSRRCKDSPHFDIGFGLDTTSVVANEDFMDVSAPDLGLTEATPSLKCFRITMKAILSKLGKKVDKVCENPKYPKLERFCVFRKHKPEVACGIVVGYLDPDKYALGYCAAKESPASPSASP